MADVDVCCSGCGFFLRNAYMIGNDYLGLCLNQADQIKLKLSQLLRHVRTIPSPSSGMFDKTDPSIP